MGRGKYSPGRLSEGPHDFNAYGETPPPHPGQEAYDTRVHFGNYNAAGYDSYGYSAWRADGTFAGHGDGVDIYGYTENDYLTNFDDDRFNDMQFVGRHRPLLTDRGVIGALRPHGSSAPEAPLGFAGLIAALSMDGLGSIRSRLLGIWMGPDKYVEACELRPDARTLGHRDGQASMEADLVLTDDCGSRRGIRVIVRGYDTPGAEGLAYVEIHAPILTGLGG